MIMKQTARSSSRSLSAVCVAGCAARGVRIAELKDQPGKYRHKTVSVTGVVTSSWGIPLRAVPALQRRRRHAARSRWCRARAARPSKGARVQVKGKVNEVASFGGRSVGLHIQEEDRKIRS